MYSTSQHSMINDNFLVLAPLAAWFKGSSGKKTVEKSHRSHQFQSYGWSYGGLLGVRTLQSAGGMRALAFERFQQDAPCAILLQMADHGGSWRHDVGTEMESCLLRISTERIPCVFRASHFYMRQSSDRGLHSASTWSNGKNPLRCRCWSNFTRRNPRRDYPYYSLTGS